MLTGAGMALKVMMWPWLPIASTKGKEEVMGVLAWSWRGRCQESAIICPGRLRGTNERVGDHRTIHPSSLAIYPRGLEMTERASEHERRVRRAMFMGSILWGSREEPSSNSSEVQLYFEHKRDFYEN